MFIISIVNNFINGFKKVKVYQLSKLSQWNIISFKSFLEKLKIIFLWRQINNKFIQFYNYKRILMILLINWRGKIFFEGLLYFIQKFKYEYIFVFS